MKILAVLVLATSLAATSACGADRPLETRVVWSPLCFDEVDPSVANRGVFLGAVVAALAPKLISGAVDAAAATLKKAGERAELARSTAKAVTRPYAVSADADLGLAPEHGCLTVSRGEFAVQEGSGRQETTGLEWVRGVKDPVIVFEAKVKMLAGEPFFQLVPYRLRVGKFEGASFWSAKERDFTIAVSLASPGSDKPFASTVFTFSGVSEGLDLKVGSWQLAGKASAPLALPPAPESGKKAQSKQEAFVAPHVLAGAVLTAKARPEVPRTEPPPNPQVDPGVQAAIAGLCKEVQAYNKEFPRSTLSEPQCANRIALARAEVDKKLLVAQATDTLLPWAQRVCPKPERGSDGSLSCGLDLERPIKLSARFGHMVTDVAVVETQPGNKFAAYLGDALGAAKDDLTKAAAQQVVPSLVKAADIAEPHRVSRRPVGLSQTGLA